MRNHLQIQMARLALLGCAVAACTSVWGQSQRCGAGRDLVVQALERITPGSGNSDFEDALQLLKPAVSECSDLGDAWYYRSLVEQKLGHDALAKYALDKARFNDSEALRDGLNLPCSSQLLPGEESLPRRPGHAGGPSPGSRRCPAAATPGPGEAEVGAGGGHQPLQRRHNPAPELYDRRRRRLCCRASPIRASGVFRQAMSMSWSTSRRRQRTSRKD